MSLLSLVKCDYLCVRLIMALWSTLTIGVSAMHLHAVCADTCMFLCVDECKWSIQDHVCSPESGSEYMLTPTPCPCV